MTTNEFKINSKTDLKLKQYYTIWEPGIDEWCDGFEYMGFNELSNEYVFRYINGFADNCYFIMVSEKDILSNVCFDLS